MSEAAVPDRRDLEAKIVARAWADESFRERLKADPRAAVADETGITVPESVDDRGARGDTRQGLPRHSGEPYGDPGRGAGACRRQQSVGPSLMEGGR